MSESDSAAMWTVYSHFKEGVAIVSTFDRIRRSLEQSADEIHVGTVSYHDYRLHEIDTNDGFNVVLSKRESFSFEREVRLVFWDTDLAFERWPMGPDNPIRPGQNIVMTEARSLEERERMNVPGGRQVSCQLCQLVEEVFVAPTAASWFQDLISAICVRYGLHRQAKKSDLLTQPPT